MQARELVHTNHFLDADLRRADAIVVLAKNGSVRRLRACSDVPAAMPGRRHHEEYLGLLERPPICVHGDVRRESTVAAVVMQPMFRRMHVRRGRMCAATTETIDMVAAVDEKRPPDFRTRTVRLLMKIVGRDSPAMAARWAERAVVLTPFISLSVQAEGFLRTGPP